MKKQKIFTIGGATFDIFVQASDQAVFTMKTYDTIKQWLCLPHGAKVRVKGIQETFGGGATNTAVAFARMDFDVFFVGKVGAEHGYDVFNNLDNEGVSCDFAKMTKREKTSFSTIINTFDGDRTILVYPGANRFFTAKDLPLKELETADWIFLNHLSDTDTNIPRVLTKVLKKNPKIKLAWNPGNEQIAQGIQKWGKLLDHTEVLFVNKEEAAKFTRTPYQLAGFKKDDPRHHVSKSRDFLPPYADDVTDIMKAFFQYKVKHVVITDGKRGAQTSDGKRIYFCPVQKQSRVDTLGAGDGFASGFTSALILDNSLKTALIYGTLNAGSVVNHYGAQKGLLTKKEIEKAFKKQDLHVTSARL